MLYMTPDRVESLQEAIALLKAPGAPFSDVQRALVQLDKLAQDAQAELQATQARASRPDAAEAVAKMQACLDEQRGHNWVRAVKLFRELTGLSLRESKDAVESGNWRRYFEA